MSITFRMGNEERNVDVSLYSTTHDRQHAKPQDKLVRYIRTFYISNKRNKRTYSKDVDNSSKVRKVDSEKVETTYADPRHLCVTMRTLYSGSRQVYMDF
jgi:hypothetical protein